MFSQASVILSTGGAYVAWGMSVAAGMRGREEVVHGGGQCVWQGACMGGGGHAWLGRQPLRQTVRILLECILV